MSILTIKSDLEAHLTTNLTGIAIKYNNTNVYMLNGIQLTQSQIDSLLFFIEPSIIPISSDRELMSTDTPFMYEAFFQIDLYNKINTGTGLVFSTINTLDDMFREKYIGQTLCTNTKTIGSFISGEFEIVPHRIKASLWS